MKKIFSAAFIILIIPVLFPLFVKAATPSNIVQGFINDYYSKYNVTISAHNAELILDEWQSGKYMYTCATSTNLAILFSSASNRISGDTLQMYTGDILYDDSISTWQSNTSVNRTVLSGYQANSYMVFSWGLYSNYANNFIDFDNVNYMPSLPTPTPRIDYVNSWNPVTLINNVINPVIPYQLTYDPATAITGMMYVETYIKFSRPSLINVSLSGVIDTYNDVWSDPIYINTMESQTLLSDLSTISTPYILDLQAYNQDWEDFKDSVNVTYTFDDNVPTVLKTNYQDVFENKFNCVGLGGNNFALYQRYFIIDSNQNVYCGDWYVWNNGRINKVKSDDVNKDFKPGEEPNGTINVVQPNYVNDTSDNYAPSSGTSTGSDVLTIVNNLVPNYPDYPTAVSYNHDHVLTQFIQTSKQLPGFMGSFGDFLKACFGFIDESVWAVIATGFSCCIVIMIIKVL